MDRRIIHVDMDAFFAAVEQRDNPCLRGKPVIVGGEPNSRGVVSTCSYEARKFGVRSAMASKKAYQLCPQAIFIKPRFSAYSEASQIVHEIFLEYTALVEPASLDEAYLDITRENMSMSAAAETARHIQNKIFSRTSLTASAGVSYNKFLAKCGSEHKKPGGLTVIPPEKARDFIDALPIGKFFGVGKVTEQKMKESGIFTGRDLKNQGRDFLVMKFGKAGHFFYDIARGIDNRPVSSQRVRKSLGKEVTLEKDIDDMNEMQLILKGLASGVAKHLNIHSRRGRTITLKIKYHDFDSISRSTTLADPVSDEKTVFTHLSRLLNETEAGEKKVRLLGVSVSNFDIEEPDETGAQLQFNF